jgi:hypothetical protein
MPLFVIIGIKNYTDIIADTNLLIALIFIAFIPLVILLFALYIVDKVSGKFLEVREIESINEVSLEYIVTYIIPFLDINFAKPNELLALLFLFMTIGYIYVRSDLFFINPVLNLFGFNVYKVRTRSASVILISKKNKNQLRKERVYELSEGIFVGR